ncbi:MAG: hypothetical protein WA966_15030 [Ornithinimicrobium sp.]
MGRGGTADLKDQVRLYDGWAANGRGEALDLYHRYRHQNAAIADLARLVQGLW